MSADRRMALPIDHHTYLRVTTPHPVDTVVWLVNVVSSLGAGGSSPVVATGCRSQVGNVHVTEIVLSSAYPPTEAATRALAVHPLAVDASARASACAIHNFEWFVECVASTGAGEIVTYDPAGGVRVDSLEPGGSSAWRAINAMIARRTEAVELVHPRALDPRGEALRAERALTNLMAGDAACAPS